MRKWTHVQKLRKKMKGPIPDEKYAAPGYMEPWKGTRIKNSQRIPPRYRFLLRYASQYPAEIEWHLQAAIPRMWRFVEGELSYYHPKASPQKVFNILLREHVRLLKAMKKWAHADDARNTPEKYRGLTEKQRNEKVAQLIKLQGKIRYNVYQTMQNPPESLVKVMGKEKATAFWRNAGRIIFVPDYDAVYRWMDSHRRL